jgi:hypothetical protein
VLGLAALSIVWTWPLVLHFRDHIPGLSGDNFSFLWNLWWMRHALADRSESFFRSAYLFSPFGVDLVNHPHTALQGLVSATVLARASVVEAENIYIVLSVFLNAAAAYALVFDITGRRRLALAGGIIFGDSPYIAAHLLGHFDLLTAWVLPLFALLFRRALSAGPEGPTLHGRSRGPSGPGATSALLYAIGCGISVAVAAYSAYYYVVYLAIFALAYVTAWWNCIHVSVERRGESRAAFTVRLVMVGLLALDVAVLVWITVTGGTTIVLAGSPISVRGVANPLLFGWLCVIGWVLARWRVRVSFAAPAPAEFWLGTQALLVTAAVFLVLSLPLIVQAVRVVAAGRYVSQQYFWRSVPQGIDLVTIAAGNPSHPIVGGIVNRIYVALGIDRIEQIGWLGIVPLAVLFTRRGQWVDPDEARRWTVVLVVFAVWSVGPFMMIAGRNSGLPLPETLARWIPFVENARMPGRAMVGVYMALGVLMGLRLAGPKLRPADTAAPGSAISRAGFQWLLIALLGLDFLNAPLPLTALDRPLVYRRLAAISDDGAMIEVPFGIGDGLSAGIGAQDRRALYYATLHGHPMVGGFIGRMPPGVAQAYLEMPVVGELLRLSSGATAVREEERAVVPLPFRYLVLDTVKASPELVEYVHSALDLDLLERAEGKELYAVQGVKPSTFRASR